MIQVSAIVTQVCFLCLLVFDETSVSAWTPASRGNVASVQNDVVPVVTRRSILQTVSTVTAATFFGLTQVPQRTLAAASSSVPTAVDLERVRKGHARVSYLLEHWDSITQVCGTSVQSDSERKQVVRTEGGGGTSGCEKTPLNVQQYMGYKSTEDPLYRVDKLLIKAASLVDDPEGYLDVVEKYKEKADNTALMAYTSSWGEANPNGGKEVIDEYLERTKLDVIESERYLRQILGYLNLEPLPPSKNP